jgi:rhodanese-related sulfurtransferase
VIIDTRNEPAFKQEHIKGAILVPAGTLAAKFDELPKGVDRRILYLTVEHTSAGAVLEPKQGTR